MDRCENQNFEDCILCRCAFVIEERSNGNRWRKTCLEVHSCCSQGLGILIAMADALLVTARGKNFVCLPDMKAGWMSGLFRGMSLDEPAKRVVLAADVLVMVSEFYFESLTMVPM